jgi:hypothetical protein
MALNRQSSYARVQHPPLVDTALTGFLSSSFCPRGMLPKEMACYAKSRPPLWNEAYPTDKWVSFCKATTLLRKLGRRARMGKLLFIFASSRVHIGALKQTSPIDIFSWSSSVTLMKWLQLDHERFQPHPFLFICNPVFLKFNPNVNYIININK